MRTLWILASIFVIGAGARLDAQERLAVDAPAVLTWDAPAPQPNAPVHGYRVLVDGQQVGGDLAPTAVEFLVPGLSEGPHTVVVEAFNRAGATRSAPLQVTAAFDPPAPPTNLRVRPRTVTVAIEPDGRVLLTMRLEDGP